MNQSVTIVTGFFALGDTTRSNDWYFEHGKLVLAVNSNMIIYTDHECYDKIKTIRESFGFANKTHFIVKEMHDHELYKFKEMIDKNRYGDPLYVDTRNTSKYFILVSSKFEMLKISTEVNPFKSTHFIWLDFGIKNTKHSKPGMIEKIIENISNKFKCCYIHYRSINFMKNYSNWHHYFQCGIAGNVLSGDINHINQIYQLFTKKFEHIVNLGYGRAEEQIITEVERENPDLFDFYAGDYYGVLSNYINITNDIDCILNHFVSNARIDNNSKYAYKICRQIEESLNLGLLILNEYQLMKYYDEYFISSWYFNQPKCVEILKSLSNDMNKSERLCQIFEININHYTSNFDFIINLLPHSNKVKVTKNLDNQEINKLTGSSRVFIYTQNNKITGSYLLVNNPVIRPTKYFKDFGYGTIVD